MSFSPFVVMEKPRSPLPKTTFLALRSFRVLTPLSKELYLRDLIISFGSRPDARSVRLLGPCKTWYGTPLSAGRFTF